MAQLTAKEFEEAIVSLVEEMGLQRLRDKLVGMRALVSRQPLHSAQRLAQQLYMLSGGLRRQVPATFGFFAVWNETLHAKLGEEGEKQLEALAEKVNACLDERERIIPEKREELETALRAYREALEAAVGARLARLDMLLKAVPEVAEILRAS